MTDHITVESVIGRWLEHSRIYSFGEGADQRLFIGSGDLLNRNLERRVEAFIEAVTPDVRNQLNVILNALRNDREKGWIMQPDGTYEREKDNQGTSSQESLYNYFSAFRVSLTDEPDDFPAEDTPAQPQSESFDESEADGFPAEEIPADEEGEKESAEPAVQPQTRSLFSWLHRRGK